MIRSLLLLSTIFASSFWALAQAPAAPAADDPVVAVVDGRPWKKSELERLASAFPPPVAQNFYRDKRAFLQTFAVMSKLASLA